MNPDDHLANPETLTIATPPVTGAELEDFMVGSNTIGHRFRPDAAQRGAYHIDGQAVTFRYDVADQHPETLRMLTFGDSVFSRLLAEFPDPAEARFDIARVESLGRSPRQVGWYHDTEQGLTTIDTMADLNKAIHSSIRNPDIGTDATAAFVSYLDNQRTRDDDDKGSRQAERLSALRETGHRILKQATYVWLAREDTLFGTDSPPMTEQAITSMIQAEVFPFAPLATLVGIDFHLSTTDPEWQAISGGSRSSLDGRMQHLRNQAQQLLGPLAAATPEQPGHFTETKSRVMLL